MSFGLALLHQNSRILLSKSALSLVHIFIIDHWSHLSVALSQSSPLVREKKSLHLSCLKWILNKPEAEVFVDSGVSSCKKEEYEIQSILFSVMTCFWKGWNYFQQGQAESWSHIITSNTSTVLIPLQMKRGVVGVEGMGKWWRAGWLKRREDEKCFLKWLSALASSPWTLRIKPFYLDQH